LLNHLFSSVLLMFYNVCILHSCWCFNFMHLDLSRSLYQLFDVSLVHSFAKAHEGLAFHSTHASISMGDCIMLRIVALCLVSRLIQLYYSRLKCWCFCIMIGLNTINTSHLVLAFIMESFSSHCSMNCWYFQLIILKVQKYSELGLQLHTYFLRFVVEPFLKIQAVGLFFNHCQFLLIYLLMFLHISIISLNLCVKCNNIPC